MLPVVRVPWWCELSGGAGRPTVHCVLRNAASRCSLEAEAWSVARFLHAWWAENGRSTLISSTCCVI